MSPSRPSRRSSPERVTAAARHIVNVSIDPAYAQRVDAALLDACVRETLASRRLRTPRIVGVAITDTRRVRRLNRRWRGLDEPTDVLSFNTDFPGLGRPDGAQELGELVIALPVAARGARERGVALADELALLTVHGALHLLGHDHETPAEDVTMRKLERIALARVGRPQAGR